MPKIKIFIWTLFKGKILIADNLKKRGIKGSSRCPLFFDAKESIQHLFVDCSFSSQSWSSLHHPINFKIERNSSIYATIVKWKKSYPCAKKGLSAQKRIWDMLLFVLLWNFWLMRNGFFF